MLPVTDLIFVRILDKSGTISSAFNGRALRIPASINTFIHIEQENNPGQWTTYKFLVISSLNGRTIVDVERIKKNGDTNHTNQKTGTSNQESQQLERMVDQHKQKIGSGNLSAHGSFFGCWATDRDGKIRATPKRRGRSTGRRMG